MSTSIDLVDLWIAPVGDLDDTANIRVRTESDTVTTETEIRRYAGGRDRIVTRPGQSRRLQFTAVNLDRADYNTLVDRLGTLQLFREPRGRRVYGTMVGVSGDEWRARETTLGSVTITVDSSTYSEVV